MISDNVRRPCCSIRFKLKHTHLRLNTLSKLLVNNCDLLIDYPHITQLHAPCGFNIRPNMTTKCEFVGNTLTRLMLIPDLQQLLSSSLSLDVNEKKGTRIPAPLSLSTNQAVIICTRRGFYSKGVGGWSTLLLEDLPC